MNILLINVPSRRGKGGKCLPLGLLYVGGIIERGGHSVSIIDPYLDDPELIAFDKGDFSHFDIEIKANKPKIIGFGGIASSYGRTKKLSDYIHGLYPDIIQIAGGPLASIYELLLTKTHISLVFHGETEYSFPQFLKKMENNETWEGMEGVSYRKGDQVVRNHAAVQIENLDEVPYPSYHLVKLEDYYGSIHEMHHSLVADNLVGDKEEKMLEKNSSSDGFLLPIITSRGCTNKCSFCYRHMKGYRKHSVTYVINHIKYLYSHYGIRGFDFADELFNNKKDWVIAFCNALDYEKLNIHYRILGARVDRIDGEILRRLKETGCVEINYGQESGSDMILNEYKKGVTARLNREITLLTKQTGLNCPVQIVIGSPGENQKTINETIQFLIDINAENPSINYLLPFPETPIWQYVIHNGLIPDVEKYLDEVAEQGGSPIVNLTHVPDWKWRSWNFQIKNELKLNNFKRKGQILNFIFLFPVIKVLNHLFPYIPKKIIVFLKGFVY